MNVNDSLRAKLRSFFRRLAYGAGNRFRSYERQCLECVAENLPTIDRSTLEAQLQAVKVVQRFSDDKLVAIHLVDTAERDYPLFRNRAPEVYAVRLSLIPAGQNQAIVCDLVSHRGRLSSLEFSRPPTGLESRTLRCERVQLRADLGRDPGTAEATAQVIRGPLLDLIGRRCPLANIEPPVSDREIVGFSRLVSCPLPDDHIQLLRETNSFEAGPWRFHGTAARRVLHRDGNYWLLAEDATRAICVREGGSSPALYEYEQIDDTIVPLEGNFLDAMLRVLPPAAS